MQNTKISNGVNKTIIIVLAIISLGLLGYIVSTNMNSDTITLEEAKDRAEKFVNENLLQPGLTAEVGEVSEVSGLYKIPLSLPNDANVDSYITKDGKFFFPEAIDIDELTNQMANSLENNNQNQIELTTEILTEGSGEQVVKSGDSLSVDYTGTLEDGTQFDSSIGRAPFTFIIGQGQVIDGWDQGLIGMKVGEERKLIIPAELGYGTTGAGSIPPNATLIFTIKLISIDS